MSKFNTKEFKTLQEKWYSVLKETGFNDVESESERLFGLISKQTPSYDPVKSYHFEKCRKFLSEFWEESTRLRWISKADVPPRFRSLYKNELNQFIFDMYSEGVTNRAVVGMLEPSGFKKLHPVNVGRRIQRILRDADIEPITITK